MKNSIPKVALWTGLLLLIPLVLQLTIGTGVDGQGFNWKLGDFVFAGVLIFGTLAIFQYARMKSEGNTAYKIAVAMALAVTFLLVWVTGAVGIIGNENNPANLMYFAVIFIAIIGALVARFKPRGMSRAMAVAALAQFLVPVVALFLAGNAGEIAGETFWGNIGAVGVFILNTFFVALWVGSAVLFREAAGE